MDSEKKIDSTEHTLSTNERIASVAGFDPLNRMFVFALTLYGISYFLPFFSFGFFDLTETVTLAEAMSTGEIYFLLLFTLIGFITAITGIFPMVAKVIIAFILLLHGIELYVALQKNSEIRLLFRDIGIDIFSMGDVPELLEILSFGFYTMTLSLYFMIFCLFRRLELRPQGFEIAASQFTSKKESVIQWLKNFRSRINHLAQLLRCQYEDIKYTLRNYNAKPNVVALKSATDRLRKAARLKNIRDSFASLIEIFLCSLTYVLGYLKVIFSTNICGKIIVITVPLLLYSLIT